jgi:hypothetical protein
MTLKFYQESTSVFDIQNSLFDIYTLGIEMLNAE